MLAVFANIPWALVLILLPLAGGMVCFIWPRVARPVGLLTAFVVVLSVAGLGWQMQATGVYHHAVGGWGAPLGIDLYADGLSLLMLALTALVGFGVSVYSAAYFKLEYAVRFWPIWLFLLAALNALFLSADIFNLYVTSGIDGPGGRVANGVDRWQGCVEWGHALSTGNLAWVAIIPAWVLRCSITASALWTSRYLRIALMPRLRSGRHWD